MEEEQPTRNRNLALGLLLILLILVSVLVFLTFSNKTTPPDDAGVSGGNAACGQVCNVDSDCATATTGVETKCGANKTCVSTLCETSTISGTRCDCATQTKLCGEKCGYWAGNINCAAGFSCTYVNGPSCTGGFTQATGGPTYCVPVAKAGITRTKCVGNDTQNSYVTVSGQPQDLSSMTPTQIQNLLCNTVVAPVCGNGTVEGTEVCDDGNTVETDSCTNTCTIPTSQEYAGCNVLFHGDELTGEGGSSYIREGAILMKNRFGTKGLVVEDLMLQRSEAITAAVLENRDLVVLGGARTQANTNFINTISPYLASGNDRHVMVIVDGNDSPAPNGFLGQYGLSATNNYEQMGYHPIVQAATTTAELKGLTQMCFVTPGQVTHSSTTGSRKSEVASYVCNYKHSTICVWGQVKLKNGNSLHLVTSIAALGGSTRICGTNVTPTVAIQEKLLDYTCPAVVIPPIVCGDGKVETGEACDDGNTTNGDGCSSVCLVTTQCSDGVDNSDTEDTLIDCTAGAQDPGCFPNGIGGGGACDPTDNNETNATPVCGNGTKEGAEKCDDGNTTNGDGCSSVCEVTTQCNDGVDNDSDGNIDCVIGDQDPGCFPNGQGGGGTCNPLDDSEIDAPSTCGNSITEVGEACDDGNLVNGDSCSNVCQITTQCNDGVDNDSDGRIDCNEGDEDPGCYPNNNGGGGICDTDDNSELDIKPQCSDGIDNDADGTIDCMAGNEDPGCYPDGTGGGGSCNPLDTSELNGITPVTGLFTDSTRYLMIGFSWIVIGLLVFRFESLRRGGYFKRAYEESVERRMSK